MFSPTTTWAACTFTTTGGGSSNVTVVGTDGDTTASCTENLTQTVANLGGGVHFFSVNGLNTDGNFNNDGATAPRTMAAGVNAKATTSEATALGFNSTASGGGSVALGSNAKAQGNSSVAIGSGAQATLNRSIAIGEKAGINNTFVNEHIHNVAIGSLSGQNVPGQFNIGMGYDAGSGMQSAVDPKDGHIMPQDNIAIGRESGKNLMRREGDNLLTYPVGHALEGQQYQPVGAPVFNVAIGAESGINLKGVSNVALGYRAGQNVDGNSNIAVGRASGADAKGHHHIALGTGAGNKVAGAGNIALGTGGGTNVDGLRNVALAGGGSDVKGDGNLSFGIFAGNNIEGSGNIGLGGGSNVTGHHNIAIGESAGGVRKGILGSVGQVDRPNSGNIALVLQQVRVVLP